MAHAKLLPYGPQAPVPCALGHACCFTAFGVRIGIRVNEPGALGRMQLCRRKPKKPPKYRAYAPFGGALQAASIS